MPTKKSKIEEKTKQAKIELPAEPVAEDLNYSDSNSFNHGKKEKYFEGVGRRKESVARVRLYTKKSTDVIPENKILALVNEKSYEDYFKNAALQTIVEEPLKKLKSTNRFKFTAFVKGGGLAGQAQAISHGLSRTLVLFDQNFKKKLKKSGFLTRDSRVKERRKYGLKKARRAPQWSKR